MLHANVEWPPTNTHAARRPCQFRIRDLLSAWPVCKIGPSNMYSPLTLQFAFGILASLLVAGGWWYIALRLPYHWLLYGLALLATIGTLISIALAMVLEAHQSLALVGPLSKLRTAVGVFDSILFVAFAGWLTSRAPVGPNDSLRS